jgi:hypothetical protein
MTFFVNLNKHKKKPEIKVIKNYCKFILGLPYLTRNQTFALSSCETKISFVKSIFHLLIQNIRN